MVQRRNEWWSTLPTEKRRLRGEVIIQDEEQALREAKLERKGLVLWTDGVRKEDEWVRCAASATTLVSV